VELGPENSRDFGHKQLKNGYFFYLTKVMLDYSPIYIPDKELNKQIHVGYLYLG